MDIVGVVQILLSQYKYKHPKKMHGWGAQVYKVSLFSIFTNYVKYFQIPLLL